MALLVIATVYSSLVALRPLLLALGLFGSMLSAAPGADPVWTAPFPARRRSVGRPCRHLGVEPVVLGLAVGLLTSAYAPARMTWSAPPTCSGSSASSPPPSSPNRRA